MPPKRCDPEKAFSEAPKRKMMTISEKVKLLDMIKEGRSYASVARLYGVNESTVRYIKKEEANIRRTASITFNKEAKRVVTPRNKIIVKMEAVLALWIADCRKKAMNLDTNMIRTKAKALYDQVLHNDDNEKGEEGADELQTSNSTSRSDLPPRGQDFLASKGWFEKFQKRYSFRTGLLYGEASSADNNATCPYVEEENDKEDEEKTEMSALTLENLHQLCNMARAMQEFAQDIDDNMVRAAEFSNRIDGAMSVYQEILQGKKRQRQQLFISMFQTKIKPLALQSASPAEESPSEPKASTSQVRASPPPNTRLIDSLRKQC